MPDADVPRRPPGRSASRLDRREGLDWLGGHPSRGAGPGLRLLLRLGRLIAFVVCRLKIRREGLEHVPAGGGYILACAIHRSWVDPLVLVHGFPLEPRIWYLGSAETTFRSRSREWLMRRIGGILPVWRGGTDVEMHVESAAAVLHAGAVFGIFPEGSRRGEAASLSQFRRGIGLIGLRTGAPILPVALAGTSELYRGRRVALRVLPPTTALDLAGLAAAPPPGSPEELQVAHRVTDALAMLLAPDVAGLADWFEDPPSVRRRWRWLRDLIR
ncbi:MAG: lysophospholipid acyltransferase family protein [Candidatus Limnocylindrales bacterium]